MTVETLPDVEGALRDHLRTVPEITELVGQRVFFGIPDGQTQWPVITVARAGGVEDESEAPIDQALITISCWGAERNKAQAWAVAAAVCGWARTVRRATDLTEEVVAYGITVDGPLWEPDNTDRPRYVITASVMARSA